MKIWTWMTTAGCVFVLGSLPAFGQALAPAVNALPVPPESVARDAEGRTTVRAVRLTEPLRVDGRLDEQLYNTVTPISDFIQTEPVPDAAATERTDVWLSFDEENVYVSVRAWESQPERMIVNEMRRDSGSILQNENFAFVFDTFADRRNGIVFNINPIGGRMDGQISNEGNYNGDWNPVWDLAVSRFEGGWSAEAALPFKSLRYSSDTSQVWGFNARRINRWKNEISYLARVPNGTGVEGLTRVSSAATMVGLEVPRVRYLDIKPFAISDLTSDASPTPRVSHDLSGDAGLDVKYGVTRGLTADLTYRTDFAQVEADEQQVNLTRFSLFFPEKREFFLENQGIFQFGGAGGFGAVPFAFYSRRIGLDGGREVPIEGGGRLTGRIGDYTLGVLNVQTDGTDTGGQPTNFSVTRLRRDILRRSSVGALVTRRSQSILGTGSNELYGVDARFAFFQNLTFDSYWATTRTNGLDRDDSSYRAQLRYDADRYGLTLHHLHVGEHFNPETGFVFRDDITKTFGQVRFSPRPRNIPTIRKFTFQAQMDYFENASAGYLETRQTQGQFAIDFRSSDIFRVTYDDFYERLVQPFAIAPGVIIPAGRYSFGNLKTEFTVGQQRPVSGTLSVERGTFWDGHKTGVGFSSGRAKLTPQLAVEPGLSLNRVDLPFGSFTTKLVSSRVTYTVTPMMFVSSLVQFNSSISQLSANVRLRWEYQPGSELFVVYNEGRDTQSAGFPGLQNRTFVVKVNRLLRL
jgi:hypothetical protein